MTQAKATRKVGIFAAVLTMLALTVSMAAAAVTFHSGPDVTFSGDSATATFNVSGLGNDPAAAQLDVFGSVETICHNGGKNGQEAPGQNPAEAQGSSGIVPLKKSEKNGRSTVSITVELVPPAVPSATDAGCPNDNWTVTLGDLTITSATLTIYQPLGNVIYGPVTFFP